VEGLDELAFLKDREELPVGVLAEVLRVTDGESVDFKYREVL